MKDVNHIPYFTHSPQEKDLTETHTHLEIDKIDWNLEVTLVNVMYHKVADGTSNLTWYMLLPVKSSLPYEIVKGSKVI